MPVFFVTERRTQFSKEETPFTDERYAQYFDGEDCLFSDLDLATAPDKKQSLAHFTLRKRFRYSRKAHAMENSVIIGWHSKILQSRTTVAT